MKPLVLASASPRRRKLLAVLGVPFEVVVTAVEEVLLDRQPGATARENCGRKHRACCALRPGACVLAADTVIELDGRCVSKPRDFEDAVGMLRAFSGRCHDVLTGIAMGTGPEDLQVEVVRSTVCFRSLSSDDIEAYFERVDPLDKAGAYDIDQHNERIIASYTGSFTNIVGLPMERVTEWLGARGYLPAGRERT